MGGGRMGQERDLVGWAQLLKANWEKRAASNERDFFVASHPGWEDSDRWSAQARQDVAMMLHGLDSDWVCAADTLEVGCGVGRLAALLSGRVQSYTGFDIASGMVAEARRRVGGDARFFVSDGISIPAPARDRSYKLAIAQAVFIHCPKEVIESLVKDTLSLLSAGGRLRFQLLGDPRDTEGLGGPLPEIDTAANEMVEMEESAPAESLPLLEGEYYMGHGFSHAEATSLFGELGAGLQLFRPDPYHFYGEVLARGC